MSGQPTRNETPKQPQFGRYRVVRELGAGGMGAVYLAHDDMLRRDVAVKTMARLGLLAGEEFRARFFNEARCVAALKHPNIVPIYDMGIEGGVPFLVMEVIEGPSLQERLGEGACLAPDDARALGVQIANALAEAHRAGIVHRDLKPANILDTGAGVWKLVDFGVARTPNSSLTVEGQFLGTPAYAAPETLENYTFGPAADVWGLGATLYEALTGAPPYGHGTGLKIAVEANLGPPVTLKQCAPHLPAALADAIMTALDRDPNLRPDAATFAERLATADQAIPAPNPDRGPWPLISLGAAAALMLTAVGLIAYESASGSDEREVPPFSTSATASSPSRPAEPVAEPPAAVKRPAVRATPAQRQPSQAAAPTTRPVGAPEADIEGLPDLRSLNTRASRRATRTLEQLRKQHPNSAYLPYLQGSLYLDRMWWKDGFDSYRLAIRKDPRYRNHAPLIRDALRALTSQSQAWRGQEFLLRDIGRPAIPHLERFIAETGNAKVRQRAARILAQLKRS